MFYLRISKKSTNMSDNNIKLHRVLKASAEKVYRAFTDSKALECWIPPYGFIATIHERDVKEGGTYKMSFTNFTSGKSHSFGGTILEMKQNEFIKYSDMFDDPNLPGEMMTSVWLRPVMVGTEISILQENIPPMIPLEMCYLGWQESLEKLAKLVEPNIPDA
jgi:uncharacterized protein YndB with AHSA1/START domain